MQACWNGLGDLGLVGDYVLETCWDIFGRCCKLFGVVWGVLASPGAGFHMLVYRFFVYVDIEGFLVLLLKLFAGVL